MLWQSLIFPDSHLPYEGTPFYVMRELAKQVPYLRRIYSLGDLAELESVSRHVKSSVAVDSLADEVEYLNSHLDWFESEFPKVPFHWIMGNHEARLHKWLCENGRALLGCVSLEGLVRARERKTLVIEPYTARQLVRIPNSKTYLRHEPRRGGKHHARMTGEASSTNLIYGHTHQVQDITLKNELGHLRRTVSLGFLGNPKESVFEYRGPDDHWSAAVAVHTYNDKTRAEHLEVIHIHDNEAYYNGKIIKAKIP